MGTNVIVITVDGNLYKIEKNGISDFALIGVLECVLADLKAVNRKGEVKSAPKTIENEGKPDSLKEDPIIEKKEGPVIEKEIEHAETEVAVREEHSEVKQPVENAQVTFAAPPSDLKSRIIKARQAIRDLSGQVDDLDLSKMTDEELQTEFDELTAQYKRLKSSQAAKKR